MTLSLSIKLKLTLWYLFVCVVLITVSSITAYFLLSSGLKDKAVHPWDMRYAQIQETPEGQYIIVGFSQPGSDNAGDPGQATLTRTYTRSELLELSSPEGIITIDDILIAETALNTLNVFDDYRLWLYSDVYGNITNVMAVTQSTNEINAILETFRNILIIIGPVALIMAGLFGYLLVKRSLQPVQSMASTVRDIEERHLNKRLEVYGNDELGYLASTFNRMLERLEEAFQREKQFTADASHELRTPLAAIQAGATLTLNKKRSEDEYRKTIQDVYQEAEGMSSILNRLLFLARNEDIRQLEFETINLKNLITELISDIEMLCEEKSIHCQLYVYEDVLVKGDKVSLREMFFNLIDNAVKYTPEGGRVTLKIAKEKNYASVTVKDTGIGISEEHIEKIFNRFYRVDKYRSRKEGGAGLGLSICRRITEIHGGTIEVKSQFGEGSTFRVKLPIHLPSDT